MVVLRTAPLNHTSNPGKHVLYFYYMSSISIPSGTTFVLKILHFKRVPPDESRSSAAFLIHAIPGRSEKGTVNWQRAASDFSCMFTS